MGRPTSSSTFLSLAFSTRYGRLHPLSQLALFLRGEMQIPITALTTFADRNVEEDTDQDELDRVWQDAEAARRDHRTVIKRAGIRRRAYRVLTDDAPDLASRLVDLKPWPKGGPTNARIRLSFEL